MTEDRKFSKTTGDIANLLGCSSRTVTRAVDDGQIPAIRVRGRLRFNEKQVVLALSNQATKKTGGGGAGRTGSA